MNRIIFILIDGLKARPARTHMPSMRRLCENGLARSFLLLAERPPLSRPVYATLLTGLAPAEHGILSNQDSRALTAPTIFAKARAGGLATAAAAYHWFYELSLGRPFDPVQNRFLDEPGGDIRHGIFYWHDEYPDGELFGDAEYLRRCHNPDFLLAHCMGVDCTGHLAGGLSENYGEAVARVDRLLDEYLGAWLAMGYNAMISSDHGMGVDGTHGKPSPESLAVPLWLAGPAWQGLPAPRRQTEIAPLLAKALGLE